MRNTKSRRVCQPRGTPLSLDGPPGALSKPQKAVSNSPVCSSITAQVSDTINKNSSSGEITSTTISASIKPLQTITDSESTVFAERNYADKTKKTELLTKFENSSTPSKLDKSLEANTANTAPLSPPITPGSSTTGPILKSAILENPQNVIHPSIHPSLHNIENSCRRISSSLKQLMSIYKIPDSDLDIVFLTDEISHIKSNVLLFSRPSYPSNKTKATTPASADTMDSNTQTSTDLVNSNTQTSTDSSDSTTQTSTDSSHSTTQTSTDSSDSASQTITIPDWCTGPRNYELAQIAQLKDCLAAATLQPSPTPIHTELSTENVILPTSASSVTTQPQHAQAKTADMSTTTRSWAAVVKRESKPDPPTWQQHPAKVEARKKRRVTSKLFRLSNPLTFTRIHFLIPNTMGLRKCPSGSKLRTALWDIVKFLGIRKGVIDVSIIGCHTMELYVVDSHMDSVLSALTKNQLKPITDLDLMEPPDWNPSMDMESKVTRRLVWKYYHARLVNLRKCILLGLPENVQAQITETASSMGSRYKSNKLPLFLEDEDNHDVYSTASAADDDAASTTLWF